MEEILKLYSPGTNYSLERREDNHWGGEKVFLKGGSLSIPLEIIPGKHQELPPLLVIHGLGITQRKKIFLINSLLPLVHSGPTLIFYTLPHHLERGNWRLISKMNDEQFFSFYRQAVSEIRSLLNWYRKEKGNEEFHLLGISIGGMVGIISMAVDQRIKKAVFLVTGGDYEKILWGGIMRFFIPKDCDRKTCHLLHSEYREILKREEYERLLELERKCFLYDPLTFAHLLKGRKVLMVNSLGDMIIPLSSVFTFRKRAGAPPLLLLPATHLTSVSFFPLLIKRIKRFLQD